MTTKKQPENQLGDYICEEPVQAPESEDDVDNTAEPDVYEIEGFPVGERLDKVLAVIDGDKITVGTPVVEGAKVDASVVKNGKGKKILVFKYKPKKGYRKRQGHRQPYTKVTIGKISV